MEPGRVYGVEPYRERLGECRVIYRNAVRHAHQPLGVDDHAFAEGTWEPCRIADQLGPIRPRGVWHGAYQRAHRIAACSARSVIEDLGAELVAEHHGRRSCAHRGEAIEHVEVGTADPARTRGQENLSGAG